MGDGEGAGAAARQAFYAEVDRFVAWHLAGNPVAATELGLHRYDHRLADTSPAGLAAARAGFADYLARLAASPAAGDPEWAIDRQLMAAFARRQLRTFDAQDLPHRSPDYYGAEALFGPYSLLMKEFAPLPERLRNLTGRLADVPRVLADAERNLAVCPRLWIDVAAESAAGGRALFEHLIPALVQAVQPDDPVLAARIAATNQKAIAAVGRYQQFLIETLRPRAGGTFAVGEATWNAIVRDEHMLDLDAAAIEAIGQELIRETQALLADEAAAISAREGGPARTWQELLDVVRADHPTRADLVPAYQRAMEESRAFVVAHDLATLPPDEHLHIAETPAFIRPFYPFAAYVQPGPFETRQLGIFWVTPVPPGLPPAETETLLRGHPRVKIPIMAVHEGYPGHHLQLTRASQVRTLPRKIGHDLANLLIEGWAFYCEELMEQQGFLTDPRGRLMRLAEQLWRACRIVIDVGIHCRGMDFTAAVALLVDVARLEPPNARAEVQRYSQSPTQPMSYLMGKREILRLAADYRARDVAAGRAFDLKRFHDALLSCGSLPPRLLRLALFAADPTPGD
ncbi:MAG TPA: DUF885 domain-containing protein [Chloroflexia bacterium]|nr:DUF885 domain-containing protein [Chloroflexia bacterium]